MIWIILGINLPKLKIRAESFDEALTKARMVNTNYCAGYVFKEDDDQ